MAIEYRKPGEIGKTSKSAKPDVGVVEKFKAEIAEIADDPKAGKKKVAVSIRLDPEITEFFKATGLGWQTAINAVLLRYVRHKKGG
jgi:uncharacterized protein (DUF4415 family)